MPKAYRVGRVSRSVASANAASETRQPHRTLPGTLPLVRSTVPETTPVSTTVPGEAFAPVDWALFVAIGTIWGASFLFIDIGLDALPPGLITLMRVGLGALALAIARRSRARTRIAPEDRMRVGLVAVLWVALPFTLFPIAEQHISSAVAGLLNGGTPIFTAIFAVILFRRPTRGAQLAGIVVGFVGVVFVSLPSIGEGSSEAFGVALVVLATVCYGVAVNLAAPLQQRYGSIDLMATVLAIATVLTAPFGLAQVGDAEWEIGPLVAVSVLGVVGTGLAFVLMGTLVGRVGSTRASFITYLIPVVALGLGVAFRGDEVFALELVGVVLVIGGAFLASRRTAT
jgi:drug/metabolite transporter (DMT)-like permease